VRIRIPSYIALTAICIALLSADPAFAQFSQQGTKLVGSGAIGNAQQGTSVAVSADGNTAIVGGPIDGGSLGAAWVYTRSGGVWTQQGSKLVGSGVVGIAQQGISVALSADGNTAIVGGNRDNGSVGAAWIWTRSAGVWSQQGSKLVGSGNAGASQQGISVSLSADGNTAIIGGAADSASTGAAWVFTRSAGVWTQQGDKLVGSGSVGASVQGTAVALSPEGDTAIIGGPGDSTNVGAAWIWVRTAGVWAQQGAKLLGSDRSGASRQGASVALSSNGTTAVVGAPADSTNVGAAWIWVRTGIDPVWTQQGPKLVGSGAVGPAGQGVSVSASLNGHAVVVGGNLDNANIGAAWSWTRSGTVWSQQGAKLVGSDPIGAPQQGQSVALSADANTAFLGGPGENGTAGAVWVFIATAPAITTQPENQTVAPGATATFTAGASGNPTPLVQWQVSTNGGTSFTDISGATSTTYSFIAAASDNGKQYRAVFTNSAGSATTNAATLTVTNAPSIVTHPSNQTVTAGATATFTAAASGAPAPTVQWQVSTNAGASFSDISGATSTTYSFTTVAADNGKQYRAVFTNSFGSTATNAATLTVTSAPAIVAQPTNQTVSPGTTATFTAAASGIPTPTVQWQVSTNGGSTFTDVAGATATTYSFTASTGDNGKQFRAVFTNASGSATTSAATLTVSLPRMAIDKTSLRFAAVSSGTAFTSKTPAQTVRLSQIGVGTVGWSAASTVPWLVVSPASGSGSAVLSISVQFAAGLVGTQTGRINLTLTGSSNTVGPINVTLTVTSSAASPSVPFGNLDTPVGDATVLSGSVAVTGWALDDIGVQRVELWRDLQPGETTTPFASTPSDPRNGKVFIATAAFVEGARPDIEGIYPAIPMNQRAGWGYLMLTWGLANQGNGTYRLYAFAFDEENNVATIGSKSIIVNNNAATKPFGSIDTPAFGGEASGPNFGWALTPKVNNVAVCKIQATGVQVSIDSGPLQPVVYGTARSDIAAAFPGFSNSAAAGGHYIFDWSTLTNGTHTIAWLVTDDCNRSEGVGSRFFTVSTGQNLLAAPTAGMVAAPMTESSDPVTVARGHGELPEILNPGETGSRVVEVKQGERIEIRLPRGYESASQLVNGGQNRALPIGATWDAASGIFSWEPAPGFLGRYRFVFSNGSQRISVRVIVTP
jgi:hypothetical protein